MHVLLSNFLYNTTEFVWKLTHKGGYLKTKWWFNFLFYGCFFSGKYIKKKIPKQGLSTKPLFESSWPDWLKWKLEKVSQEERDCFQIMPTRMLDEMISVFNNCFPIEFSTVSFKVHSQVDQMAQQEKELAVWAWQSHFDPQNPHKDGRRDSTCSPWQANTCSFLKLYSLVLHYCITYYTMPLMNNDDN